MPDGKANILVIDDELNICQNCTKVLSSRAGYEVEYALNGYEALAMMEKTPYALVITDLKMGRMGGMEVLRRIKESHPDTLVIVMTGYATVGSAVEVMKTGAFDYLPKPFTPEELRAVVRAALAERDQRIQNRKLTQQGSVHAFVSHQLIGSSPQIKRVVAMVGKVAPTDATVLLCGESGTGKELIARAIHVNSKKKDKVFFAIDCATLSADLLESEMFGYRKGAFTGAYADKQGVFEMADKGTVFLDEIGNIPLEVQGKLLRFLETKEFLPRGGTTNRKVDVRLIFATNRDLKEQVHRGLFREDFYYRIYVYPILLPPLRDRRMDILPIAYHFLRQFSEVLGKSIKGFEDQAVNRLVSYDWPGNVRQLRNVVERAAILCEKEWIDVRDLPFLDEVDSIMDQIPSTNDELKRQKKEIRERAVNQLEKRFLLTALIQNDWNVSRTAEKVGLQRTNLQGLMKKHGIRRPSGTGSRRETST